MALYTPDPSIVRQLKAIDPGLSVDFFDPPGRFAVLHSLQVPGNFDASVDAGAHELMYQLALSGYVRPLEECGRLVREKARTWQLVCYCANDDGSFRPLDARLVTKLRRMKWLCEEVGLTGIRQMLQARADAVERVRRRDADTIWDDIRNDKVAAHCLSNVLWGVKHPLHHQVKGLDNEVDQRDAVHGEGGSQEAVHPRPGGDALPGSDPGTEDG